MNDKKIFSRIGLIMLIGTLIITVVQVVGMALVPYIPAVIPSGDLSTLATLLPMYIIAYPIIFLLFKKMPVQLTEEKKKMPVGHLIAACVMCYALAIIFNLIGTFVTGIIAAMKQGEVENVLATVTSNISPATNFLLIVLCAPIFEELLFRKAIISRISKYGDSVAIIFSALIFGLFHGNLLQGGYAFILGIFFGYVFIKTGKVIYCIIMHMFVNFMGSFVGPLLMELTNYTEYEAKLAELTTAGASQDELTAFMTENMSTALLVGGWGWLVIILAIVGIILLLVNRKKFVFAPGEILMEKGKRFKTVYLNVGMILYCVFWIGMIVMQLLG